MITSGGFTAAFDILGPIFGQASGIEVGLAVPVVDELASIDLDLWAVEQGLSKLHTNLLGM